MNGPRPIENVNPLVQRIFERADDMGITDRQLALRSGYGPTTVYRWRHRRYRRDRLQMLVDFATVLGLEVTITETPTTRGNDHEVVLDAPTRR